MNSLRTYILLLVGTVSVSMSCSRAVHSSSPKPNSADSLSFIVLGDWGKKGKQAQRRVAAAMTTYVQKHPVQFIISTGDNFYWEGVNSTTDPHWKQSFENIYTHSGLQVPWYPVLGNHDHALNPQAQVDYSKSSNKWSMPGFYYSVKKKLAGTRDVLLLFLDTSPLVKDYYPNGLPNLDKRDTAKQRKWLLQELNGSKEQWKIVVGHHPIYSAGKHGNTPDLIRLFKPALLQYGVDFYLSGHDHSLQCLQVPGESIHYLVSGGGSERTPVNAHNYDIFTRSVPGFLVMTLYADKAKFYFYNGAGSLLYSQEVRKK